MPKDYVAAYERIAREEHREHGLVELEATSPVTKIYLVSFTLNCY